MIRRQHRKTPVTARTAGTIPNKVQRASANQPNLPKCNELSQVNAGSVKRSAGSMKPKRALNHSGNAKYSPEVPHIRTKRRLQNPSALWRSQLIRAKEDFQFTVRARRQFAIPGHQITAPVKHKEI